MNNISKKFERLKRQKKIAFMPFLVAGDPDFKKSLKAAQLIASKADLLEIGFPYSDPLADGPTIQKADMRSLNSGMNTDKVFKYIKALRITTDIPITVLVYANLVYQRGVRRFYKDAASAGIDAVLIPDLPVEEIDPYFREAKRVGIDQIFLVSQTTTDQRLKKILKYAQGYLYLVSILGVTGARAGVAKETLNLIKQVKRRTKLPAVVGFGISQAAQIQALKRAGADGAIVGSALIDFVNKNLNKPDFKKKLFNFLGSLRV